MAKNLPPESQSSTPSRFAKTTPESASGSDYSFVLPTLIDLSKSVAQVNQAVINLSETQKEHTNKLEAIGQDVHTGKVALRVISFVAIGLGGLLAWILARAWDVILKSYIPGAHP